MSAYNSTIKRKSGKCSGEGCDYEGVLYAAGKCKSCYWMSKTKKKSVKIPKASGQKTLFAQVYVAQNGKCWLTGSKLDIARATATMFPHILSKGAYPKFKLYSKNVRFIAEERFHILYDCNSREDLEKEYPQYLDKIQEWYDLKDELKAEYNKLFHS